MHGAEHGPAHQVSGLREPQTRHAVHRWVRVGLSSGGSGLGFVPQVVGFAVPLVGWGSFHRWVRVGVRSTGGSGLGFVPLVREVPRVGEGWGLFHRLSQGWGSTGG